MKRAGHKVYIGSMAMILIGVTAYLAYRGYSYYNTGLEERFYHIDHENLKPSGLVGHGLGIIGSLLMLFGVSLYMLRKRARAFSRLGLLKHWLEFHIFLCLLGPSLVLFHTSLKIGGLVAISFWCMVAVVLSGVIGRFIYIRIPRTIEGRELSLNEIKELQSDIRSVLITDYSLDQQSLDAIVESNRSRGNIKTDIRRLKHILKANHLSRSQQSHVLKLVRNEISMNRRIERLQMMQNLFRYWHVAHLPFALVMLIIMVVHVAVSVIFGYTWIL